MVVPDVMALFLLLKIVHSPEVLDPLPTAQSFDILKVWVLPADEMPISEPDVPDAKVCTRPVRPFSDVIPPSVYDGMLSTPVVELYVAAPLEPVVVSEMALLDLAFVKYIFVPSDTTLVFNVCQVLSPLKY